ncbi:MAG TPA: hypothetical protein VNK24_04955 [Elusimicrobiota bacterium]|nr:hypothetical protein [Elusimicrobiota bacterium]
MILESHQPADKVGAFLGLPRSRLFEDAQASTIRESLQVNPFAGRCLLNPKEAKPVGGHELAVNGEILLRALFLLFQNLNEQFKRGNAPARQLAIHEEPIREKSVGQRQVVSWNTGRANEEFIEGFLLLDFQGAEYLSPAPEPIPVF